MGLGTGAWPSKRPIQQPVQEPPARLVLASQVSDGDTVALTVRDGRLEIAPLVVAQPVKGA